MPAPPGTSSAPTPVRNDIPRPAVELVTYPHVGSVMCRELDRAEQSIVGTAYCLDYAEGIQVLSRKRADNVSIRIIIDQGQCANPSGRRQIGSILHLMQWGVEFRKWKPDRGKFAIMHAKSWMIDGSIALIGSVNFTDNGVNHSEELLTVVRDDDFITPYMEWFERIWAIASVVEREALEAGIDAQNARRR